MSHLTDKSHINFLSAEELETKKYYCSSVHCSYYSSVQLMKHILLTKIGMSENQIRAEVSKIDGGTHEYLINTVLIFLRKKGQNWRKFQADIGDAKILRVKADYKDEEILDKEAEISIQLAVTNNIILNAVI